MTCLDVVHASVITDLFAIRFFVAAVSAWSHLPTSLVVATERIRVGVGVLANGGTPELT